MTRTRLLSILFLLTAAGLFGHELTAKMQNQFTTRSAVAAIEGYRQYVSPHLAGRVTCRFTPTCSAYGLASVKKYGALRGGFRSLKRILRCNPWTPRGTVDLP